MAELVEEIASIVRGETSYSSRTEKASMLMAKVLIARILKAVVDGMPLPGEVGRGDGRVGGDYQFPDVRKGWNRPDFRWGWGRKLMKAGFHSKAAEGTDLDELEGEVISFIALRKEENIK